MKKYLSDEEIKELVVLAQKKSSKTAVSKIVNNYENLVYKSSYNFFKATGERLELEELQQEAYAAILVAIKKYDASKGAKFTTYLTRYINGFHNRFLESSNTVKIPTRDFWLLNKVNKRKASLGMEYTDVIPEEKFNDFVDIFPNEKFMREFLYTYSNLAFYTVATNLDEVDSDSINKKLKLYSISNFNKQLIRESILKEMEKYSIEELDFIFKKELWEFLEIEKPENFKSIKRDTSRVKRLKKLKNEFYSFINDLIGE